jgi:hypothetical protein
MVMGAGQCCTNRSTGCQCGPGVVVGAQLSAATLKPIASHDPSWNLPLPDVVPLGQGQQQDADLERVQHASPACESSVRVRTDMLPALLASCAPPQTLIAIATSAPTPCIDVGRQRVMATQKRPIQVTLILSPYAPLSAIQRHLLINRSPTACVAQNPIIDVETRVIMHARKPHNHS